MKSNRFLFWVDSTALGTLYLLVLVGQVYALEVLVGYLGFSIHVQDWKTLRQKEKAAEFQQIIKEFQCKMKQNQK